MPQQNGNCNKVCDKATALDIPLTCSETWEAAQDVVINMIIRLQI